MTDRGYGRISLATERSGSLGKQRSRITAFAGADIQWYEDESVSGSKVAFADRPSGGRLLADLQRGDRVLVTKIDRAARSVRDLLNLVERIDAIGASIVFVDQNIDTSGPMGRFILTLLGAIAELEAAIIAERRRESLEQFAQEGRHAVGKAPYGFESVPNPNGKGLVIRPHPERGPLLAAAIERVLGGETQESLAAELGLSKSGFHRLLTNPRLAGMTPDGEGVVTIDGIPRVDPDAALLSMAEWDRLQAFLESDKSWARHEGIGAALVCSVCGDRMYFQQSKRKSDYATYKCRRVRPAHANGEPAPSVIARNAEAYAEKSFLERFGNTAGVLTYWEGSDAERAEAIGLARVRLNEVRRRQDEAITDEDEEALMAEYLAAKRALREAEAIPSTRQLVTTPSGRTWGEDWEDGDWEAKVRMLKLVGSWEVRPGRLPIDEKIVLIESKPDLTPALQGLRPLAAEDI